ncbi:MAG TPA: hypothetical protein VGO76_10840 [Luteibacter sp.]|jgi:hypothetical protein|nr:hypothetical protein [Luteibacter sp.]
MNMNAAMQALEPVYQHHDLLIELGQVEMAIEHLDERDTHEQVALRPRLEQRMTRLQQAIASLAA